MSLSLILSFTGSKIVPNVLIDITRLVYRRWIGKLPTGVDRVSLEYLRHYAGNSRAALSWGPFSSVLSAADSARAFGMLLDFGADGAGEVRRLIAKACLVGWRNPDIAGSFMFNTGHLGLEHKHYAAMLRHRGARPVFMVHDLIPLTHPEYCRPGEREHHLVRMRNAVTMGHGIIANSQDTLDVLTHFVDSNGLQMPPTVVAPLAPGLPNVAPGARPLPHPYFVMLSTIEPRKNHWLLLQLWRRLVERLGDAAPHLVVIGQRGWECENVVDLLERCEPLRGFVHEHSACSDAELVTFLAHAQALLFPSFVEGFGLPLIEALSLGVPAIASDLAVFREFAGTVPEYVDPLDGARWMALIEDYAKPQSTSRAAQLDRLVSFRPPTWAQHMQKVDEFLVLLGREDKQKKMGYPDLTVGKGWF